MPAPPPINPSASSSQATIDSIDIIPLHATTRSNARLGSDINPLDDVYTVTPEPTATDANRTKRTGVLDMALTVTSCSPINQQ